MLVREYTCLRGPGSIVWWRLAPPSYTNVVAISVVLDHKKGVAGYSGTTFNIEEVNLADFKVGQIVPAKSFPLLPIGTILSGVDDVFSKSRIKKISEFDYQFIDCPGMVAEKDIWFKRNRQILKLPPDDCDYDDSDFKWE